MALFGTPLSLGGESLVDRIEIFDVVIVGSGYGGSVAAARLTDRLHKSSGEPLTVCVLERGLEHPPGSFPSRFADLPGHIRINRSDTPEITGDAAGLFDLRIGEDVSVLVGNGLGGGSLINASVAEEPDREVFRSWPGPLRDPRELRRYFDVAAGMLGASPAATEGLRKYREFASWAEGLGLRPQPARVAVTFRSTDDNGHGVRQDACINCGDCVTGCNFHAKNTLPMNYLARAKRNKAQIYTGVTVSHVEPTANSEWIVHYRLTPRPGSRS
jgi:cholesterol oxidase